MKNILLDKKVLSWALYDWANSAFATTIVAGFFPVFYSSLTEDLTAADSQFWFNITLAVGSILIAVAAPVLGAIADYGGSRKKFLATFAMLGIIMSAALAWVGAGMWWMGLLLYGLGQIGFSGANIFYDSMIVDVSDSENVDVVSGYGYAMGYIGGGLLFLVNVLMVTKPDLFGIPDVGTAVSLSFISVAIWWAAFTIPLLRNIKDRPAVGGGGHASRVRQGIRQLRDTWREIRRLRPALLLLLAYLAVYRWRGHDLQNGSVLCGPDPVASSRVPDHRTVADPVRGISRCPVLRLAGKAHRSPSRHSDRSCGVCLRDLLRLALARLRNGFLFAGGGYRPGPGRCSRA